MRLARTRILILSEQMEVGGTQKEVLLLCKRLQKLGHVPILASNGGRLVGDLMSLGIRHYAVPYRTGRRCYVPMSMIVFPYSLYRIIKIVKSNQVDLIHAYAYFFPLSIGYLASKILRIPLVITINDGILDYPEKLAILKSIDLARCANRLIVISSEMKNLLSGRDQISSPEDRIVVIPNMVDLHEFSPGAKTFGNEVCTGARTILWVGRLSSDKIDAIRSVANSASVIAGEGFKVRLIIAGAGPRIGIVRELAEEINQSNGRELVIVTGFLGDVVSAIRSADIVVGMGKVAIEAMACGKPVVVVGHIKGPQGGNFGGVVHESNVRTHLAHNYSGRQSKMVVSGDNISKACIQLLTDEKRRQTLGKFGRRFVEKTHDARIISKQIEDIYLACRIVKS